MTNDRWRQIEELFHAARDHEPAARDAFLAAACAGNQALRDEVESLLAQPDGGLLTGGVAASAADRAPRTNYEGQVLGTYLLGRLLGAGGMGDVYEASDQRLGRRVAVKILPERLGQSPQRLARFEREARALAALNHSHVGAIFGIEERDGVRALVLELVDGVTLKQRLAQGAVPVDEALSIARQIALALEAAHHKGIVHRDLKPENIKITSSGAVKVLDFGLAKIAAGEESGPEALPVFATADGVVLGTVAYMSPEQARGHAVDKRADIWAFGCVLYEMLTGVRPFAGDTAVDVLTSLTAAQPDWTKLPPATPRRVRHLLRRCLTKDPDRRLHDIADARIELEEGSDAAALEEIDRAPHGTGPTSRRWPWVMAASGGVVAAAVLLASFPRITTSEAPATRVSLDLPAAVALDAVGRGSSVAVSPDGRRVVFVGVVDGQLQLYMRALDEAEPTPIAGTDGGANPFFSPDGKWIAFTVAKVGALKKVPVEGGAATTVLEGPAQGFTVQNGVWEAGHTILFSASNPRGRGLWRIADSGGTPERVTTPREDELLHSWPQSLDGGAVVYTIWNNTGFDGGRIAVQSQPSSPPRILVERGSYPCIVTSQAGESYLVYAKPEGIFAAGFDRQRLELSGAARPVVTGVATNLSGGAHFSVSPTGVLAYIPGALDEVNKTLVWVSRDGSATEYGPIPGIGFQFKLTADGRRVVRPNANGPDRDLWVDDLGARRTSTRLTFGEVTNFPIWAPDGRSVIYSAGTGNLFRRAADGSGEAERLTTSPNRQTPGSISPDGLTLAYSDEDPVRAADLWLLPLQGERRPRLFLATPAAEVNPVISPNGKWMAYQSNITGRFEIYLTLFASGGRGMQVSQGGGSVPRWSRDGHELYYRGTDANAAAGSAMMAVTTSGSGEMPTIGVPRTLFTDQYQGDGDVAADGRFLLLKRTPSESTSRSIRLVLNWFEDLR